MVHLNYSISKLLYLNRVRVLLPLLMQGYVATTVQQYLSDHPVDEKDVVHVEDGGWVNPDGDFGSPQSLQWNYPLLPNNSQVNANPSD